MTETAALSVCFAEEPWVLQQSFDAEMPLHVFPTLKVLFCGFKDFIDTSPVTCVKYFSVRSWAERQGREVRPAASAVLAAVCVPACHGGGRFHVRLLQVPASPQVCLVYFGITHQYLLP